MTPQFRYTLARTNSVLTTVALGVYCFAVIGSTNHSQTAVAAVAPASAVGSEALFEKITDFTVNGQVAEILTASPAGNTLVYSNASDKQIGFIDINDPAKPRDTRQIKVGGEPTSVAISPDGKWLLCCMPGEPNRLLVFDFKTRQLLRQIDLPGQPDCVSISPDGRFAAIAIENERRSENMDKPMPQMPAGSLTIVDMKGAPAAWKLRQVDLRGLPLRFPTDPEPEFISIDSKNRAAVTLQENNGIVIVDLPAGKILNSFSAGTTTHSADLKDDGRVDFSGELRDSPREPDAIGWTRGGNLITANEGDYDTELKKGQYIGGRNATLFSPGGKVLFDFNDIESAVAAAGRYNDKRSGKKGVEPEGVAIARFTVQKKDRDLAFIGCERADSVAVYDIANETQPKLLQVLPTGKGPEGLLALSKRGLFVSANEGDGTVSIFKLK